MSIKSIVGIVAGITLLMTFSVTTLTIKQTEAFVLPGLGGRSEPKAPMAASADNLYIVWWTNKSGNWEVMFRASNDAGQTIGDKINLSNSSNSDSQNAEILASGNNVYVSWWETSTENDNGNTFGPILMLGNNGTLTGGGGGQGQGAGAAANMTAVQ